VADNPRIEELRRRVQKDPASIAFAQLAEEHRRAGAYDEAARVCRAGLDRHPTYLSARVTLGRALIELGQYDEAEAELQYVLRSAPENLAAIRGLGEIHQRRGNLTEALRQFQTALALAKHDPELEESVHDLTRQLRAADRDRPWPEAQRPREIADMGSRGAERPITRHTGEPPAIPLSALSPELEAAADEFTRALQALDALSLDLPMPPPEGDGESEHDEEEQEEQDETQEQDETPIAPAAEPEVEAPVATLAGDEAVVNELESWLDAIIRDRENRAAQQS
jgi:tetratricopeptide (TPR) repeat protein